MSTEDGFEGLLHYIVYHLQGAIRQETKLPFDKEYLLDVYSACINIKSKEITSSLKALIESYMLFIDNKTHFDYSFNPINFVSNTLKVNNDKLIANPLGLTNGLAGELLKLISN